jgi:colicin import membrane protein
MRPNQYIRQDIKVRPETGLGRMIAVSFVVHLAFFGLFSGVLIPRMSKSPRPVYVVDLVNLPVKDPQAGRPDARPQPTQKDKKPTPPAAEPEPKPKAVKLPPKPAAKPEPKPEPKSTPKVESKPESKPAVKPTPKEKTKPVVTKKDDQKVSNAIEDLRRRQERQALKDKLAAMSGKDTRTAAGNAPVGMPDGKGSQAGIAADVWLQNFLKEAWRLSKYQVGRPDVEATVQIFFNSAGRLKDYKFIKESGDSRFDDSVKRAIFELNDLSEPLQMLAGMKPEVVFNLKDLQQ